MGKMRNTHRVGKVRDNLWDRNVLMVVFKEIFY